ncbi:MAG TPA: peptide chain release factor N(5)-glutamine methyltransferase [bacterium]|nr:peptide chain release factor N(5)-glutamine methyltransferase [bacterium]
MTFAELLTAARKRLEKAGVDTPLLDAEVLLAHAAGVKRIDLYTNRNESPAEKQIESFDSMIRRREERCPVAYITGTREFWSLEIRVNPEVLIPRPETELVVQRALAFLGDKGKDPEAVFDILDLCTGSGCIAAALAHEIPGAHLTVTDASRRALCVAKENLAFAEGRVRFLEGDLFEALRTAEDPSPAESGGSGLFDLIVSNPPYIPEKLLASLAPEICRHEPSGALNGGESGLDFALRIIEDAVPFLKKGAALIMEIGSDQSAALARAVSNRRDYAGFSVSEDLSGMERVITAWKS